MIKLNTPTMRMLATVMATIISTIVRPLTGVLFLGINSWLRCTFMLFYLTISLAIYSFTHQYTIDKRSNIGIDRELRHTDINNHRKDFIDSACSRVGKCVS